MRLVMKIGRSLRRFLPRDGIKLVAFAHHRLLDAFGVFREIKTKASLHAKKILVDAA